jgi:hypothetical protein
VELSLVDGNHGAYMNISKACLSLVWIAEIALSYPTPVDFNGQLLRWDLSPENPRLNYELITEGFESPNLYGTSVSLAANLWNDVATSYIHLAKADEGAQAHITIRLEKSLTDATFSSGFAEFDELEDDGTPLHCLMTVGAGDAQSITSISKTILHEFGHCIGLGHSLVPEAIMSYRLDKNSFALSVDDRAAASRLYPQNGETPRLPKGCAMGSFSSTRRPPKDKKAGVTWVLLLFLACPLFAIRLPQLIWSKRTELR